MGDEDNLHQLHIEIPVSMHDELKKVLPERGAITGLVRSFLRQYLLHYKNMNGISASPFDKATNTVFLKSLMKGIKGESDGT